LTDIFLFENVNFAFVITIILLFKAPRSVPFFLVKKTAYFFSNYHLIKKMDVSGNKPNFVLVPISIAAIGILASIPFFKGVLSKRLEIPFMPTTNEKLTTISKLLQNRITAKSRFIDIGSGDGRVVKHVSREFGCVAFGVERNKTLYLISKISTCFNRKTRFLCEDFNNHSLKGYDCVMVFGIPSLMDTLGRKFNWELEPGSFILVNKFKLSGIEWETRLMAIENEIYLYRV
jgi:Histone methylation protein DOT1